MIRGKAQWGLISEMWRGAETDAPLLTIVFALIVSAASVQA
jgi:hypothetical protein